MINHGTTGGYYAHRRLSEDACDACKKAVNKYLRTYRATKGADRVRTRDQIRRKALATLRDLHREEYDTLVHDLEIQTFGDPLK